MARLIVVVCLLLLVVVPLFTNAQETTQPAATDNLCFEGGSLAGQCFTDAQWTCGWYMAWYLHTGQNVIPAECATLFPVGSGTPVAPPLAPVAPATGPASDNACYAGGSLAGTCMTDSQWVCGWYLAHYQAGALSSDQVLDSCRGLLGLGGGSGGSSSHDDDDDDDDESSPPRATRTPTPTPTITVTPGPSPTPSDTATSTNTATPSDTPTSTNTATPSDTPTPTETAGP